MNTSNYQLWLKEDEKEIIMKYILDRRYPFMTGLYYAIPISIILALSFYSLLPMSKGIDLMFKYILNGYDQDLYLIIVFISILWAIIEQFRKKKKSSVSAMILAILFCLLYCLPVGGTFLIDLIRWLAFLGLSASPFLVMFFKGYGKQFGKNSDYDCIRNDEYQLEFCEFGGKEADSGKPPYYIKDSDGNTYECPVFMDWKKAQEGDSLICITLNNGKKYALLKKVTLDKF